MKLIRYKCNIPVIDRETRFQFEPGEVVTVKRIIDQERPCVFVRCEGMKKDESTPVSLDVFRFAFVEFSK